MFALFARLFALRPILSLALFGFPILLLVAIGLFTIVVLKTLVFVVLPIVFVVWLFRKASSTTVS